MHIWQPGTTTGTALAKILYGIESPSGKLAMTFPRTVGQVPIFYNKNQSARVGDRNWSGLYQDIESTPMYEFGYGLSYTTFKYDDLSFDEESMTASVKITNIGKHIGKETVLWYVVDPEATITQPIKKLKYFEKIQLKPDESIKVSFKIDKYTHLSYPDSKGNIIFEPGDFEIKVNELTTSFNLSDD